MHTSVPHDHDGTRAYLGGATPTTVLESALKQVTFTAILPVRREVLVAPALPASSRFSYILLMGMHLHGAYT
jgi:hypothetical protein